MAHSIFARPLQRPSPPPDHQGGPAVSSDSVDVSVTGLTDRVSYNLFSFLCQGSLAQRFVRFIHSSLHEVILASFLGLCSIPL